MLTRIGILETEKGLSSDFSSSLSLFQKKEKERLIKNLLVIRTQLSSGEHADALFLVHMKNTRLSF